MIVQTAPENAPHFVIEQTDHARVSGQIARIFGNEDFGSPVPTELVVYTAEHHDEGWGAIDALREQSPITGLPYHLTQTPLPYLLITSKGSPDFNEQHHPFCGLLSSMHTYGLFNGRYGLSDFVFIDRVSEEHKTAMLKMLGQELERQGRLKKQLPEAWVAEENLFANYKLLQFFDTLALYFQLSHSKDRVPTSFKNVPDGRWHDLTLTITPNPDGTYTLAPWPFSTPELTLTTEGRYLTPQPQGTDFKKIFEVTPKETQQYRLVKRDS
ncbi:MAG TPA: DUF3891 family protein [Anaerolineales bacterium]|nr:DUF3891 family protein [Anaerolineales bacterium]